IPPWPSICRISYRVPRIVPGARDVPEAASPPVTGVAAATDQALPTSLAGLDTWGPAAIVAPSNSNCVLHLEQRSADGGLTVGNWGLSFIFAGFKRPKHSKTTGS